MEQTFWNILKKSQIEIPEIQRDYAQGRETSRAIAIRKKFIRDLLETCKSESKSLHLNFIFGQSIDRGIANFEKSKESLQQMVHVLENFSERNSIDFNYQLGTYPKQRSNNCVLIPIDGQQRLTTLFLLHLYVGAQVPKCDLKNLKGFQYKTRKSSSSFIEKLLEQSELLTQEETKCNISPSEKIQDQAWFFRFWKKDPTVTGMLVVLDEIYQQSKFFNNADFRYIWSNLTENDCIKFDFFDLKEEGLEDDLYIKMNGRGKSLSEFENFKAWLEKKYKSSIEIKVDNWPQKLDKDWLDIFWSEREIIEKVDEHYLSFFNHIGLFKKLEKLKSDGKQLTKDTKELIQNLSSPNFLPTQYYEDKEIHNKKSINEAFQLLELLKSKEDRRKLNEIVDEIWSETFYQDYKQTVNKFTTAFLQGFRSLSRLNHKVFIYSIMTFLLKMEKPLSAYSNSDKDCFIDWLRVSRNVIYNSRIDNDFRYVSAIQALNEFAIETIDILNIRQLLTKQEFDKRWISFFNEKQLNEEVEKAKLGSEWNTMIVKAENHHYFYGQIGFILELSKIDGSIDLSEFENYFEKLQNLFSTEHLDGNEYLIQRALLTIGNINAQWMKQMSSNRWSFYTPLRSNSRERDENWRNLFNNNPDKLKALLDQSDCTTSSLHEIIESGKKSINDWRIHFILEPELFNYCHQKLINWNGEAHIRLLGQSRLSHYHSELRITALYIWLKKEKSFKSKLEKVKRGDDISSISFERDQSEYKVTYDPKKGFLFKLKEETEYKEIDTDFVLNNEIEEFNKIEK